MIDFRLPAFLEQKLSTQDTEVRLLSAVVNEAIYYFGEWFRDSTRPFFPHYTDHNLTHLEGVLATCCSLMTEKAKELFSPADAAALILSVLFHDSAMQISKDAFYQLVHNTSERPLIKPFDSLSWQDTWNDFFFIARRWDDTKLIDVFGRELYGKSQKLVRNPFPHWGNLSDEDYLLVGEFIRQHHARFAHEAALYGIPGVTGNMYTLNKGITQEQRDIIGLIGRSHNLPLRTCTDYLLDKYHNKRQYQDIHAVYLMILLRVADYLQIKANRSSLLTFQYKKIPSRLSEQEHKAHASIRDINAENDDSEALEILAQPQDAPTYLRVQDWLHGIQSELDTSWAVIGEVYNKGILNGIGLKFRRIKSNLDNITHFKQQVDYIPDLIKFDVAHAEVLKLLIGPLYGEDPSYGVRELMQNSVDAINERLQFVKLHPIAQEKIYSDYKPEVKIHLSQPNDKGIANFTISDNGIGMTENVIKNYFLRAGSSYRQSEQWKRIFEDDYTDSKSTVNVLRSGRFGVGALAAFLIGIKITVSTKYISSEYGYEFSSRLDSSAIQVRKVDNLPVGTTIVIETSSDNYNKLIDSNENDIRPYNWNWYLFDKPLISRTLEVNNSVFDANLSSYQRRIEEDDFLEDDYSEDYYEAEELTASEANVFDVNNQANNWRKIDSDFSYSIYWKHRAINARWYRVSLKNKTHLYEEGLLICNGFFVCKEINSGHTRTSSRIPKASLRISQDNILHFSFPHISIIDLNGDFPISLRRDGLTLDKYPFESELLKDIAMDLLAWIFFNGPSSFDTIENTVTDYSKWFGEAGRNMFVASAYGYGISTTSLLENWPLKNLVQFTYNQAVIIKIKKPSHRTIVLANSSPNTYSNSLFNSISFYNKGRKSNAKYARSFARKYKNSDNTKLEDTLEKGPKGWQISSSKLCPPSNISVKVSEHNKGYTPEDGDLIAKELFFKDGSYIKITHSYWLIDNLWKELFGNKWLPYSLADRINTFPHLVSVFSKYYNAPNTSNR